LQQSLPTHLIIALILILGCVGLAVIGFLGYRLVFPGQNPSPTQGVIAQGAAPSSTVSKMADQSSITETPAVPPTITQTPVPEATYTPLVSNTPTVDPNATQTPIPENKIGTSVGQFPPDFTLINAISNAEVNLYEHFGQPIVLVFFYTLAVESEPEMPGLQAIYEKYQDQGVVVLGIGVGSSQSALRNYTGRFGGLTFPLLSDWEHTIARSYDVSGVPTTFFIRKNGKIWQVNYGAMKEDELDAVVSSILRMP
jgi:peroxiredoxin